MPLLQLLRSRWEMGGQGEGLNDVGFVFPNEEVEVAGRDDAAGAVLGVAVALAEVGADVGEAFDQVAVARQDQGRDEAVARVQQLEHRPAIEPKPVVDYYNHIQNNTCNIFWKKKQSYNYINE